MRTNTMYKIWAILNGKNLTDIMEEKSGFFNLFSYRCLFHLAWIVLRKNTNLFLYQKQCIDLIYLINIWIVDMTTRNTRNECTNTTTVRIYFHITVQFSICVVQVINFLLWRWFGICVRSWGLELHLTKQTEPSAWISHTYAFQAGYNKHGVHWCIWVQNAKYVVLVVHKELPGWL
jgi:hypothetical protein